MISTFYRKFFGRVLVVLGESMFVLGVLPIDTTWRFVGLSAVLLGVYILWLRQRTDSLYGGTTLVLSWLCVALGFVVIVESVLIKDLIIGVLAGLFGVFVGVEGILKANAGE